MKELTRAQEEIMQYVWDLNRCTVGDIREAIEKKTGEKPPHSTVSAIVLTLDKLGFLEHETYGRTFVYQPVIGREEYGDRSLRKLIRKYFNNSAPAMVARLIRKENLNLEEIDDLMKKLEEE